MHKLNITHKQTNQKTVDFWNRFSNFKDKEKTFKTGRKDKLPKSK